MAIRRWLVGCLALAAAFAAAPPPRSPLVCVRVFPAAKGERLCVPALSPDGRLLASCHERFVGDGTEYTLRECSAIDGRVRRSCQAPVWMQSLAYSPDGKPLALTTGRGVYVWDLADLPPQSEPDWGGRGSVRFSAKKGSTLGHVDRTMATVYDLGARKMTTVARLEVPTEGAVFGPDLSLLAVPDEQDVDLWDVAAKKVVRTLGEHRGVVRALAFSPDGKRLAALAHRLTPQRRHASELRLWEVRTGRLLWTADLGECYPRGLAFSGGDGGWLLAAARRGVDGPGLLRLFDADRGEQRAAYTFPPTETVVDVTAAAAVPRFATSHADGSVRLWDVRPR
jgi:WD40 repeat protein